MPRKYNREKNDSTDRAVRITPRTAPDTNGQSVNITVRIDPEDKERLSQLPGGLSANARKAILQFLEQVDPQDPDPLS
jgi:uncharacterized ferredoxin-like protein